MHWFQNARPAAEQGVLVSYIGLESNPGQVALRTARDQAAVSWSNAYTGAASAAERRPGGARFRSCLQDFCSTPSLAAKWMAELGGRRQEAEQIERRQPKRARLDCSYFFCKSLALMRMIMGGLRQFAKPSNGGNHGHARREDTVRARASVSSAGL